MTVSLDDIEAQIYETYHWFHREAPFVKPVESGRLGRLWAEFDRLVSEEG